jgi:FMN phosphatase YigB (HAD superfamily)
MPADAIGAKRVGMRAAWRMRPDRARLPTLIPGAQIGYLQKLLDLWTERQGA